MKAIIGVETFEEMQKRKLRWARVLDKGFAVEPEKRIIMFENPEALLNCLDGSPIRACNVMSTKTAHPPNSPVTTDLSTVY